jgi:DNA adenine methylase
MRYHGGKWKLAPWIISYFPEHTVYIEPFGGAASVLLQKPRSYSEVYNDLNSDVVNVFRVLRDPMQAGRLCRLLELTPFSREEYGSLYERSEDPIEAARRFIARSTMGLGADSTNRNNGFRYGLQNPKVSHAREWMNYPPHIEQFAKRLAGVVIENRPALQVISMFDHRNALFYMDPPYVHTTRSATCKNAYRHEMSDADHLELAKIAHQVKGMVIISGYRCELYDELYKDWLRVDRAAMAEFAKARIESLWISPRIKVVQKDLFS